MTEEDFRDLLAMVQQQLNALGMGELADDELYVVPDHPEQLLPPEQHLIAMLKYTDEWLGLLESETVLRALKNIQEVAPNSPLAAEIEWPEDRSRKIDLLQDLANLTDIRGQLRSIASLLNDLPPGTEPEAEPETGPSM